MFRLRRRAAIGGLVATMLVSAGLVAVSAGSAHAAATTGTTVSPMDHICRPSIGNPRRTGLNPKVTVTANIRCTRDDAVLYIDVWVAHLGGGQEATRRCVGRQADLSCSVSRTCVTGAYRGRALVAVDVPGEIFERIIFSQDVFIDCG